MTRKMTEADQVKNSIRYMINACFESISIFFTSIRLLSCMHKLIKFFKKISYHSLALRSCYCLYQHYMRIQDYLCNGLSQTMIASVSMVQSLCIVSSFSITCSQIIHSLYSIFYFVYQWFEEKHNQVETLEQQLKKLHAACESLVNLKKGNSFSNSLFMK